MLVIRGSNPSKKTLAQIKQSRGGNLNAAITIGNFDGIHLGHQAIFQQLFQASEAKKLLKVLITFEPRPVDYFIGSELTQGRLSLLSDKIPLLDSAGFDLAWVLNFNSKLANLTPEQFLSLLTRYLDIKTILVGQDFQFGKDRKGDKKLLANYANDNSINFISADDYIISKTRVSSSYIRKLLLAEQGYSLKSVSTYLGRHYGFSGRVIYGNQNGRKLGYPTINIHVKQRQLLLARGVYAVRVQIGKQQYQGMANWGYRPTIAKKNELILEANLFKFSRQIYGNKVYIEFLEKIRDERKFKSPGDLRQQLDKDNTAVLNYFRANK